MLSLSVNVRGVRDASELLRDVADRHRRTPEPLWQKLADVWRRSMADNLVRGGNPPFVPLSETTIKLRGRSGVPLLVSGRLQASIETLATSGTRFEFGSRYNLARLHELGFVTGAGSMIPGRKVPARPWIHLDDQALETSWGLVDSFALGD